MSELEPNELVKAREFIENRDFGKASQILKDFGERKEISSYEQISYWLGFQPSLCKETQEVWDALGWKFNGCNCTP